MYFKESGAQGLTLIDLVKTSYEGGLVLPVIV